MAKRVTRTFEVDGKDYISSNYGVTGHTTVRTFLPADPRVFQEAGLDSSIKLGRLDLDRLNNARKIKVTITAID